MILTSLIAASAAVAEPAPVSQPAATPAPAAEEKMACCEKMAKGQGCDCCKDMDKMGGSAPAAGQHDGHGSHDQ